MKYAIEADAEFLRVMMSGREDDEPPSHVCKVVLMESARLARPRILIELDQKIPLSPTSQYRLVTNLPKLGFTTEERIALVHRAPEHQHAGHFITLLGRNHDVMVRNFTTLDAAKAWLRGADA